MGTAQKLSSEIHSNERMRYCDRATKDGHLRIALKRRLLTRYSDHPSTLILEELGLKHGAARIDIAVVNGDLHGYELKSDSDTLSRLPRQATHLRLPCDVVVVPTLLARTKGLPY
jgi:hypothetical protein